MQVKELILLLQSVDPELRCVVNGYEGGVDDIDSIETCSLELDIHAGSSFYGRHGLSAIGTPAILIVPKENS